MYIITTKDTNAICGVGESLEYLDNGYPRLINEDVAFVIGIVNVNEVEDMPQEAEMFKWCYTPHDGFYPNPKWEEPNPYNIPNEVYNSIIDDYTDELIEMGVL